MTLPSTIEPHIAVSWDGSGAFTGTYDDVTADGLADAGIHLSLGRDGAQTLSPPKIGDASFALRNDQSTYSQDNAQSPVYQRVIPGRPVRYQVGFGERRLWRSHNLWRQHIPWRGLGVWGMGRHIIDDIDPSTELGNQRVAFTTLSYETIMTRAPISIAVQTTPLVSDCVTLILNAVGWPADKRSIATSDTRLLYWWADERMPWDALLELLRAEGPGTFYVDGDGVFHFENRNFRTTTPRSTTSQATFWDRAFGNQTSYRSHVLWRDHRLWRGRSTGLFFTAIKPGTGFKSIYNRATYTSRQRTLGTLTSVWQYGSNLVLSASQAITLIARPADPFQNAITPALTTDYTVSGGTVSVSMSATSGLVAYITITATSGTPTVSGLQMRAQLLTSTYETTVVNSVDASASIAKFSPIPGQNIPITLDVGGWPEIDQPSAEAVCNAWVNRYQIQRPQIEITIANATSDLLEQILRRRPSDRITLVESNSGLSADVWVNTIDTRISGAGGRLVECVLGCEKTEEFGGAVWDQSIWDALTAIWGI